MNKRQLASITLAGIAFVGGSLWCVYSALQRTYTDRKQVAAQTTAAPIAAVEPAKVAAAPIPVVAVETAAPATVAAEVAKEPLPAVQVEGPHPISLSSWERDALTDAATLSELLTQTLPLPAGQPVLAQAKEEPAPQVEPIAPGAVGHVVLLCTGDRVTVRGEVPTESVKERLEEKARKSYPDLQVCSEVRVTPELSKPEEGLNLTLLSFPTAPKSQTPGMMATAVVGQPWRHIAIPAGGLSAEHLPRLGLFPAEFNAARALADCRELLPQLKAHLNALPLLKTASRDSL